MERYLEQLIADIDYSTENVGWPFQEKNPGFFDWVTEEEEEYTAPIRNLEEWSGINKEQLPPSELLSDHQISQLLSALKSLLDAYNCSFVLQIQVPERIQYATIRENFNQEVKVKQWHMGFFELCHPGTEHGQCSLGDYCQCRFFEELFSEFSDEELSPEEERAMLLDCEINYLKRKHGDDWIKYYPYHLDPDYDDENGNPHDYGFGEHGEDDDLDDDWWRR